MIRVPLSIPHWSEASSQTEANFYQYCRDARRAEGHEADVHRAALIRTFLEPHAVLCDWMDNGWQRPEPKRHETNVLKDPSLL